MVTVGVRELKQHTSKLIQSVREEGGVIFVTYRGKVVAKIVPVRNSDFEEREESWATLDDLAAEVSSGWPEGVSAVEAVAEGRR